MSARCGPKWPSVFAAKCETKESNLPPCRTRTRRRFVPTSTPIESIWVWCLAAFRPTHIGTCVKWRRSASSRSICLVRREILQNGPASLDVLRGLRVSLGEQGTNGAILAADLLRFAGLRPTTAKSPGDFETVYTREAEMIAQLRTWKRAAAPVRAVLAERLPDAFFVVDSLPSPVVDELVKTAGYQFVPLPYATALRLNNRRDDAHLEGGLESNRIEAVTIPAFTYGIAPAAPPQDCQTFGLRLLLDCTQGRAAHGGGAAAAGARQGPGPTISRRSRRRRASPASSRSIPARRRLPKIAGRCR